MQLLRIKSAFNNLTLKCISSIIGFGIWFMLNQSQSTTLTLEVPVCFYNVHNHVTIDSPDKVTVTLNGKRADLYNLDLATLSLHCDAAQLHPGENPLIVSGSSLFLPSLIKLVSYYPLNAVITVKMATTLQESQASS